MKILFKIKFKKKIILENWDIKKTRKGKVTKENGQNIKKIDHKDIFDII